MEKRLSRTDLGFSLAFLLLLIVAVGAFFYGVKVGTDRAEARQQQEADLAAAVQPPVGAYQQQDLVSFYHTVFLPYREFLNEWQKTQERWLGDSSLDRSAALKELSKLAGKQYDAVGKTPAPAASPLLKSAQTGYMKSLKLFADAFAAEAPGAGDGTSTQTLEKIRGNAFYKEGVSQALAGQDAYYASMLKWAATVDPDIPSDYKPDEALELSEWKSLPLIVKNVVIADLMKSGGMLTGYLPQDMTARIDLFVASGQADRMKQKTVRSAAELLVGTEAVRSGDFLDNRDRLYGEDEQLPQLPFFFAGN